MSTLKLYANKLISNKDFKFYLAIWFIGFIAVYFNIYVFIPMAILGTILGLIGFFLNEYFQSYEKYEEANMALMLSACCSLIAIAALLGIILFLKL